jgi:hypothetical protein
MLAPSGMDLGLVHPVNLSRELRIRNLFSLAEPALKVRCRVPAA